MSRCRAFYFRHRYEQPSKVYCGLARCEIEPADHLRVGRVREVRAGDDHGVLSPHALPLRGHRAEQRRNSVLEIHRLDSGEVVYSIHGYLEEGGLREGSCSKGRFKVRCDTSYQIVCLNQLSIYLLASEATVKPSVTYIEAQSLNIDHCASRVVSILR